MGKDKKTGAPAGMDLQDFISQTLSAIALAVPAANQAVLEQDPKREGDTIFKLNPSVQRSAKSPLTKGEAIQFDVAVQAAPPASEGGPPRLLVPVLDTGSKSKNSSSEGLSRVRFEIHVHHAVGEGRKGGG